VPRGTPGGRLYLIRLACGDGARKPESMASFAKRVEASTGKRYDPSAISLLERNEQGWRLVDVATFASIDPLMRGRTWLACFDLPEEQPAIVGTIQPDLPGGAPLEPVIPAPRKGAAALKDAHAARSRGKKK
jgi:hypothetical protein